MSHFSASLVSSGSDVSKHVFLLLKRKKVGVSSRDSNLVGYGNLVSSVSGVGWGEGGYREREGRWEGGREGSEREEE